MRILFRWSAAASTATGLGYGWTRYFGARMTEFGPEAHPWQAGLQHAHVLAGPVMVFILGLVAGLHALPAYRGGGVPGRRTGVLVGVAAPVLVLSGYLVQVAVAPGLRAAFAWVHGGAALVALAAGLGHLVRAARVRRNGGATLG